MFAVAQFIGCRIQLLCGPTCPCQFLSRRRCAVRRGRTGSPARAPTSHGPSFRFDLPGEFMSTAPHGLRVGGHTHIFRFAVPYRVLKLAAAAQGMRGNRSKLSAYGFASHNFSRLTKYQNVCGTAARSGSNILCRSKHSKFSGPLPGQIQFFLARGSAIAQASLLAQNLQSVSLRTRFLLCLTLIISRFHHELQVP